MKGSNVVIFDIGGVLAQDVWEHLFQEKIGPQYNLEWSELKRVGELLWEVFAYRPLLLGMNCWEMEAEYWRLFIRFFKEKLPPGIKPKEFIDMTDVFIMAADNDMEQLLRELKSRNVKLGICSNNNEFWSRRQMEKLGLYEFFQPEKIILSCRVGFSKSSPRLEMFRASVNAMESDAKNCVVVDDREGNIQRAKEAGMEGILFTSAVDLAIKLRKYW